LSLTGIDTIVFLMLENRSFDQMLGYLSLDETRGSLPVDGIRSDPDWRFPFANVSRGAEYPIRKISANQQIKQDPPHGYGSIAMQINMAPRGPGASMMGGFVESYVKAHKRVDDPGVVMGYYDAKDVPSYDFLARNFCVCDKWFTSLPLGTQANRLMAMAGESLVLDNVTGLPEQRLVYDWLEERGVPWRVYVSGGYAPFFIMMRRWAFRIVKSLALGGDNFRRFSALRRDWLSAEKMPSVIFIEPEYADAPMSTPNDDHPPAPISRGQDFVREIYTILTSNKERWSSTLMIVTYDEHGGFFDHVPPPKVETEVAGVTLKNLGPRVPALLVSQHVAAGQVFSEPLDHTSVLQLLAERFGEGAPYSAAVARRQAHLGRISSALLAEPRKGKSPSMPPRPRKLGAAPPPVPSVPTAPDTPNAAAIDAIMRELAREHPELLNQPAWGEMKVYLETNTPPTPRHRDSLGDADEL
jgi:phospholipase C